MSKLYGVCIYCSINICTKCTLNNYCHHTDNNRTICINHIKNQFIIDINKYRVCIVKNNITSKDHQAYTNYMHKLKNINYMPALFKSYYNDLEVLD